MSDRTGVRSHVSFASRFGQLSPNRPVARLHVHSFAQSARKQSQEYRRSFEPKFVLSCAPVHPIEMLRAVARSRLDSPGELAAEAAWGLGALAEEEPAAVLPACRRLLERQPACGPLWWLAARMLTAGDAAGEAELCASLLLEDRTSEVLHSTLLASAGGEVPRVVRRGGVGEIATADFVLSRRLR